MWAEARSLLPGLGVLLLFLGVMGSTAGANECEPIKIDLCRNVGYNLTTFPNLMNNTLQSDAVFEVETFAPLFETRCSSELSFFLCSVYAPMCNQQASFQGSFTSNMPRTIGPCRPLCVRVRSRCRNFMLKYGYDWPESLNCNRFPEQNSGQSMCMEGPGEGSGIGSGGGGKLPSETYGSLFHNYNTLQSNTLFMEKFKEHQETGFNYLGNVKDSWDSRHFGTIKVRRPFLPMSHHVYFTMHS